MLIQEGMNDYQARALGREEESRLEAARIVENMRKAASAAKESKNTADIDIKVEDFDATRANRLEKAAIGVNDTYLEMRGGYHILIAPKGENIEQPALPDGGRMT